MGMFSNWLGNPAMVLVAARYLGLPSKTASAAATASPKLSSGAAPDGVWPEVGKVCERPPSGRTAAAAATIGGVVRMPSIGSEDGHRLHRLVPADD
jgi:hypothetical protein